MRYTNFSILESYPPEYEDLKSIKTLKKSGIHAITARPMLFPLMMLQGGVSLTLTNIQLLQ
jgi:hypothetical protein